jgi:anti-sigma-K factor RskA
MNALNKEGPERQEIEALLPWHAAGTLNRRDSERVERAIAADRELARRFQLVREEQHETIHLNESLGVPSTRAMEKLFAAIEAEGARAPARRPFDLAGRVAAFLSSLAPRTLAYAAGAAAVALFVQAAVLTTIVVKDGGQVTSGTVELSSAPTDANYHAVIRFTPQATAADITRLLGAYNATVVDGPGRGGLYNIRFNGVDKSEIGKAVQRMQTETRIVEFIASKE